MEVPFVLGLRISERDTSVSVDVIFSAKTLPWNSQVLKKGVRVLDPETGT